MQLLDMMSAFFNYGFLTNALIVGVLVSVCSALLGVTLVLKRFSMIGDGLSHVGFGALAVAAAFNWAPLALSIPVVVAAAFLLLRLNERGKIKGDAAIALISASALAIGIFTISAVSGMNTEVDNYLFGSILALSTADVVMSVILCAFVIVVFLVFYNRIFAVTFDEVFARATGVKVELYNGVLALLTALTIVLGMRMMGALLISSLVIFPALSSMWVCKRFKSVIICSLLLALAGFFIGLVVSYIIETPTGATVVLANLLIFIAFYVVHKIRRV